MRKKQCIVPNEKQGGGNRKERTSRRYVHRARIDGTDERRPLRTPTGTFRRLKIGKTRKTRLKERQCLVPKNKVCEVMFSSISSVDVECVRNDEGRVGFTNYIDEG